MILKLYIVLFEKYNVTYIIPVYDYFEISEIIMKLLDEKKKLRRISKIFNTIFFLI